MNKKQKTALIAIGVATLYAVILRVIFGFEAWNELLTVMSLTFLFLLPTIVGLLTVYLSNDAQAKHITYRIFAPWIPIFLFLIITLALALEGWACWLMILPLFLIAASLGGLLGGYFKGRKKANKLNLSFIVLLPFFTGYFEHLLETIPATYEAYTYIDIQAPADQIWNQVTRVSEIPEDEDRGFLNWLLGFPRPLSAVLNYEGVGAYRKAVFTGGLVFHETVTEYIDQEKMVFTIDAYPHEIPSTTLDEHVVIGGQYFDVLNGTYELEPLGNGLHRLHLYSRFEMKTTFNFYAGWWARWIMKDIQNNILKVEKRRAEVGRNNA